MQAFAVYCRDLNLHVCIFVVYNSSSTEIFFITLSSPVHTGNKVDCIGDKVDHDKLSNSRCCGFVTKTSNKVERIGNSRLCCHFQQQSTFNKVNCVEFNFVAMQCVPGFNTSVYRALTLLQLTQFADNHFQLSTILFLNIYTVVQKKRANFGGL